MKKRRGAAMLLGLVLVIAAVMARSQVATAQDPVPRVQRNAMGSAFTYQGQLKSGGSAYTGTCDFQFKLFDASNSGSQVGTTQTAPSVSVTGGLFTAPIDFGASAFNGDARWLEVGVRCPAGSGSYTPLSTRQPLTAAPYALYSTSAANLTGSLAGDVTGTQASTTVTKLQGRSVSLTAPGEGQVLQYSGGQWAPGALKMSYHNVIVVAKSGGDYSKIMDAVNSISGANDENRFLVKVMPGVYDERVTMKAHVDIEGSGELTTKITQPGSGGYTPTVFGANNAELRFLTIENTGNNPHAVGVYNDSTSPRLTHVTISAVGGWGTSNYGVYNYYSSAILTNVTITVSGGAGAEATGVYNYVSSSTLQTSEINASAGMNSWGVRNDNDGGAPTIKITNSRITAATNTIKNASGVVMYIATSLLYGGYPNAVGTFKCVYDYDGAYNQLDHNCQLLVVG